MDSIDNTPIDPVASGDAAAELAVLREQTIESWLTIAIAGDIVASARPQDQDALQRELQAMRETVSWRVTAPLRAVRRRI